jgi:hypothetical protein
MEVAMFQSIMQERGPVFFPGFNAERHYMVPFYQEQGLPDHLAHWQNTVDAMLVGITSDQPIYFMADQAFVPAGTTQRRPGLHVDGYWHPSLSAHGGGHTPFPPSHRGQGRHRGGGGHMTAGWENIDFSEPEALILASNVSAARAFVGEYDGLVGEGGDCSKIVVDDLAVLHMNRNRAYCGTVATLHESLPVQVDSYRTMVRLNCPGVTIQ